MSDGIDPDQDHDSGEGSRTQERFRYQAIYAVHLSLLLANPAGEITKLMCEQHEDVLLKKSNGTFVGVQVKTKDRGQGAFISTDPAIFKTIVKFVKLYQNYGNKFARFVIVSSCGFSNRSNDIYNLDFVIKQVKSGLSDDKNSAAYKYISRVCREDAGVERDQIVNVLKITELDKEAPDLIDADARILSEVASLPLLNGSSVSLIERVVNTLLDRISRASAIVYDSMNSIYTTITDDVDPSDLSAQLKNKTITEKELIDILEELTNENSGMPFEHLGTVKDFTKSDSIMRIKMERGGIKEHSIRNMSDLKNLADKLYLDWFYKKGEDKANQMVSQINIAVQTECEEAQTESERDGESYGTKMLQNVRSRLRNIVREDPELFFNSSYYQVFGIVGMLTQECKVWWSEQFDLPKEVNG